jgi:hypothetical protein
MTVQGGIGGTKTARGFTVEVTAHGNIYSGSLKVKKNSCSMMATATIILSVQNIE